jgi:hypothetical protein
LFTSGSALRPVIDVISGMVMAAEIVGDAGQNAQNHARIENFSEDTH